MQNCLPMLLTALSILRNNIPWEVHMGEIEVACKRRREALPP